MVRKFASVHKHTVIHIDMNQNKPLQYAFFTSPVPNWPNRQTRYWPQPNANEFFLNKLSVNEELQDWWDPNPIVMYG
jgi:hypothetical protein